MAAVLSALTALAALGASEVRANTVTKTSDPVQDQQVTRFCLASVSAAFEAARKVPPPGIGAYACRCFLDQVSQGAGINTAQAVCRQRTVARYSL
jgi:hypothetical protein